MLKRKNVLFWIGVATLAAALILIVGILLNRKQPAASPFGHSYRVASLEYIHMSFSFAYTPQTAPYYRLSTDGQLSVMEDHDSGEWMDAGVFTETALTNLTFDEYFTDNGWAEEDFTAAALRKGCAKAWRLDVSEAEDHVFYLLLQMKDGGRLLTYGYVGSAESAPLIRWAFRLEEADFVFCDADGERVQAKDYPDGFDFSYETLPAVTVSGSGTLRFTVSWDTDTLSVSEDYYAYTGSIARVDKEVYTLPRGADGAFELPVSRRNDTRDEKAFYYIGDAQGVHVICVNFPR